jgi:hypothetical protein
MKQDRTGYQTQRYEREGGQHRDGIRENACTLVLFMQTEVHDTAMPHIIDENQS